MKIPIAAQRSKGLMFSRDLSDDNQAAYSGG
jgi:hypothetical protein